MRIYYTDASSLGKTWQIEGVNTRSYILILVETSQMRSARSVAFGTNGVLLRLNREISV